MKSIISVVFDFDIETKKPRVNAIEYTYFSAIEVKEGDLAVVLSPHTKQLTGVLVTGTVPSVDAIRKVHKAIFGIVDASAFYDALSKERELAVDEALARFTGQI